MEFPGRQLTRMEVIKLGVLGSAALLLPLQRAARTVTINNRIPGSALPAPFRVAFATPPVLRPLKRTRTTDFYRITMRANRVQILPDPVRVARPRPISQMRPF